MTALFPLRQASAGRLAFGPCVDPADGNTEKTGLTFNQADMLLWLPGTLTLAVKHDPSGAAHMGRGVYSAPVDSTDTANVGAGEMYVHVSGMLPEKVSFVILPAVVYDALYANTGAGLRANAITLATDVVSAAAMAAGANTEIAAAVLAAFAPVRGACDANVDPTKIVMNSGTVGLSLVSGTYVGRRVFITDGNGVGESRKVTAHDGPNRTVTVETQFRYAPAVGNHFEISAV